MFQDILKSIFNRMTKEGPKWGLIRLGLVLFVLLGMVFLSSKVFTNPAHYPWILFTLAGLRYWLFPLAGLALAFILAGFYLRDLYALPNVRLGMRYLISVVFGFGLPSLKIEDGQKAIPEGQTNLLERIGGPGYINVLPGNLVLLENQSGSSNVYPAGFHFVSRREFVKEIASLADQHGYIESSDATTKDGITVTVREIRYHYRLKPSLRRGEYIPRSPADPYPYTMQSMRNYTYTRTVNPAQNPALTTVAFSMDIFVEGVISNYIYEHQFDHLVAPQLGIDPRNEIQQRFNGRESRDRQRQLGIELLWVDIGHFDVTDEVWRSRVGAWEATWVGTAEIAREDGQARRQTYHRLARAEGRVDALRAMIESLNDALDHAVQQGDQVENLRKLILLYSAQTLEEMSEMKNLPGENAPRYPKINDPEDPWRRE
jgi:hypothetical protein